MAASRRAAVAPFFAMEILKAATARAAEGARVFHMETGEPGSGAPKPVLDAAQAVLAAEKIGYTEARGVLPLRERIAVYYEERYGFVPPVERIVVTTGASAGLMLAFLAAFDVGERVALANPGYPAYRNTLQALGLEPVLLPTTAETRFQNPHRGDAGGAGEADPGPDRREPIEPDRDHERRSGGRIAAAGVRDEQGIPSDDRLQRLPHAVGCPGAR